MIRSFLAFAAAAVLGLALTPGTASACCHKKKANCAHTVIVEPAPCPPPVVEVVKVKKCGKLFHGKKCCKPAPCPPPVVETCATPVYYSAPATYYAPAPSAQAPSPQVLSAPAVPTKGTPQG
jgi:hypothetical protein